MDTLPDEIFPIIAGDDLEVIDTLRAVCGRFRALIQVPPLMLDGVVADRDDLIKYSADDNLYVYISRESSRFFDTYYTMNGKWCFIAGRKLHRLFRDLTLPLFTIVRRDGRANRREILRYQHGVYSYYISERTVQIFAQDMDVTPRTNVEFDNVLINNMYSCSVAAALMVAKSTDIALSIRVHWINARKFLALPGFYEQI